VSQQRINDAVVSLVRRHPGSTANVLERLLGRVRLPYWAGSDHFRHRLGRLVGRGQLVVLLVKGSHRYYTPEQLPAGFDLADAVARQVAADWVDEAGGPGGEALARDLRAARRIGGVKRANGGS
jgi:hypothetical protein